MKEFGCEEAAGVPGSWALVTGPASVIHLPLLLLGAGEPQPESYTVYLRAGSKSTRVSSKGPNCNFQKISNLKKLVCFRISMALQFASFIVK